MMAPTRGEPCAQATSSALPCTSTKICRIDQHGSSASWSGLQAASQSTPPWLQASLGRGSLAHLGQGGDLLKLGPG